MIAAPAGSFFTSDIEPVHKFGLFSILYSSEEVAGRFPIKKVFLEIL